MPVSLFARIGLPRETTVSVDALRAEKGTRRTYPLGQIHDVTLLGTAFAVSSTGVLVTEAHVAAPFGQSLAVAAAPLALAQTGVFGPATAYAAWVTANDIQPVGVKVVSVRVWRATASPAVTAPPVPARVIPDSAEANPDLALIQLTADHNVPALTFNKGETITTPIVTIGYGTATPTTLGLPTTLVPAIKTGQLGVSGTSPIAPGQQLTYISAPISHGDSGAPVVDAYPNAQVHGVVRFSDGSGGLIEQSQAVFDLLRARTSSRPPRRPGVRHVRDRHEGSLVGQIRRGGDGVRGDTLATPMQTHPLAAQEQQPCASGWPAAGRPRDAPRGGGCSSAGIAAIAAAAALLCAWRLRRLGRMRDGRDDAAAHAPPAQ